MVCVSFEVVIVVVVLFDEGRKYEVEWLIYMEGYKVDELEY